MIFTDFGGVCATQRLGVPRSTFGKGSHFLFSGSNDAELMYCKIVYSVKKLLDSTTIPPPE